MRPIYQIAYNVAATPQAAGANSYASSFEQTAPNAAATNSYGTPAIAIEAPIAAEVAYVAPFPPEDAQLAASSASSSYGAQAAPVAAAQYGAVVPVAVVAQPQPQQQSYASNSQYSTAQSTQIVGNAPLAAALIPLAEPVSPRPLVDFDCARRPDGYHVKQPCTPFYYHCSAGQAVELRCAADLVYDTLSATCERPGECGRPKPRTTTTRAPPTTPRSTKCVGLSDGFHEYGRCQPRYLQCSNGIAHENTCQSGLVFRNDTCVHLPDCLNPTRPAPIAVARTSPRPTSFWCQQNNKQDGSFGNGCSNKYFVCLGGTTQEMSCPSGLFFDQTLGICDQRGLVVACGGFRPPQTTTLVPPIAVARPATHYDCGGRADGFYFNGCASQYWSCNGGIGTPVPCPDGLRYSPTIHSCDYPQHIPECGGKLQPTPSPIAVGSQAPGYGPAQQAYGSSQSSSSYQSGPPAPIAAVAAPPAPTSTYGQQPTAPIAPSASNVNSYGATLVQPAAPTIAAQAQGYASSASSYEAAAPVAVAAYEAPAAPEAPAASYEAVAAPVAAAAAYETPVAAAVDSSASYNSYGSQQQAPVAAASPSSASGYSSSSSSYGSSSSGIVAPLSVATGTEDDANPCAHLTDGIYGRRCTRHYFVCSANKTYEFTCPTGYAYDKQLARCGVISGIPMCSDVKPLVA